MCKKSDEPNPLFNPNSKSKPKIWIKNWSGWHDRHLYTLHFITLVQEMVMECLMTLKLSKVRGTVLAIILQDLQLYLHPKGYTFLINSTIFTGPCQSSIMFQVDGTVIAPDGPQSWLDVSNQRQWLVFYRVNGMLLNGKGLIDGKGQKWWNLPCKPHKGINRTTLPGPCDSPMALKFFMSSNVTVHGLKIKNSPQFHFRFDNCDNITVDSISINSSALSPNTYGIYNSVIATGDDCISIGAGSFNVDITNVTCGPSHGIR